MPTLPAPNIINRFPDCVAMKLHFDEEENTRGFHKLSSIFLAKQRNTNGTHIEVSLTINFSGEQTMQIPAGKRLGFPNGEVTFGIKRGRLQLTLDNCKMPMETIGLSQTFEISTETEQQVAKEVGASLGKQGLGSLEGKQISTLKRIIETTQVKQVGAEDSPAWIFQAKGDKIILEGRLTQALLGCLRQDSFPCQVHGTFEVRSEDIQLTWGRFFLTPNIHRNKSAIIERALALKYIKPIIESAPLSEVRWQDG